MNQCVVGIALSLLAVTTSASVGCAWVLWSSNLAKSPREYTIEAASTSVGDCEQLLNACLTRLKSDPYIMSDGPKGTRFITALGKGATLKYQCLPDTVDPRGPKGT